MKFNETSTAIIIRNYQEQKVNTDDYIILQYLKKKNLINCDLISKKISKYNSILKKHLVIIKGN
jgi:hypothetical protein